MQIVSESGLSQFYRDCVRFLRGDETSQPLRLVDPPAVFYYDGRPYFGVHKAHMPAVAIVNDEGTYAFVGRCRVYHIDDYEIVDVEAAEDFCERCLMADTHMVYTFRDVSGAPLYVGQSGDPVGRMLQHRISSPWFWWSASAEAQVVDPADARRIEADRIREIDPAYNKTPRRRRAA